MTRAIEHRGPDDAGVWLDVDGALALGHRRLSIVDLSPAGHQPMASGSGRWMIVFNGEVYNHLELREALDSSSSPGWRGHSDTETLLAGFDAWGIEETLRRCVGMFALAIWDRKVRELHLVRDRMGEKPLYYGWAGDALVFGSELKALRAFPAWRGELDRDALTLLFRYNYIPAPQSIYQGVWKLPAGSILTIGGRDIGRQHLPAPRAYWSLLAAAERGASAPFSGDDREALDELERLTVQSIGLQMVADVPVGAFLSGGVDSSTIVALMQAQSSQRVRTFTIGFGEAAYNEAEYAKVVAGHIGTDHTELYVSPGEAQSVIPKLPALYDEPLSDPSQIPTFLVSQLARQQVTVSLSGDGGDEFFYGYDRYFFASRLRRNLMWLPLTARRQLARAVMGCPPRLLDAALRPFGAFIPEFRSDHPSDKAYKGAAMMALPDGAALYRRLISHWDAPSTMVLGGREPPALFDTLTAGLGAAPTFEQWMMTADSMTFLPDDLLVKTDRAAMAVSLESRMPFLDHRIVEFSLSLPLSFKRREGQGKWLLRQLLYKHVPKALIERPKMGFNVPIDSWLRGPLRPWAEELLDESRLRREGVLDPLPIRKRWLEHQSGARDWQFPLWDVLMFQSWLEAERGSVDQHAALAQEG